MAAIFNEQRVLGVRMVSDGTKLYNNQQVIGVSDAGGALFANNIRTIGVDVLDADAAIHNEQQMLGAVLIADGRKLYNGMRVVPAFAVSGSLGGGTGTPPSAPMLRLISGTIDPTPDFELFGDFLAGDVIQFERQTSGGDWSVATVSTHTVTADELNGAKINLGLPSLANGSYQVRCKYHRASSSAWSNYSNIEVVTIAVPATVLTFLGASNGDSPTNSNGNDTADFSFNLGEAADDKVIILLVTVGGDYAISGLVMDPGPSALPCTLDDMYRPTGGCTCGLFRIKVPGASGNHTFRLTTSGAAWLDRDISAYAVTGLSNPDGPKVSGRHQNTGNTNTITASPGDLLFAWGAAFGGMTWGASSEPPHASRKSGTYHGSADWTVSGNYPANTFSLVASGAVYQSAATYN